MIYATGDIHGDPERLGPEGFPAQKEMTKKDFLVILGDFGMVWNPDGEDEQERSRLDWLDARPFTTLFIDGNHENFPRLNALPVEKWHGGNVHFVRPSVIHLMRGEVYENVDGARLFAFGGAPSFDIRGLASIEELKENYSAGILDPADPDYVRKRLALDKLNDEGEKRPYRVLGRNWWPGELASDEEKENAWKNLSEYGYKVDFIFSHDGPASAVSARIPEKYWPGPQMEFLEQIKERTEYQAWFFGHYHVNRKIDEKTFCVFQQTVRIF